jgi:hypothetical protein
LEIVVSMDKELLTVDDLAAYERDGYLLVRGLFEREEVDLLRATAKRDRALDEQAVGRADGEGGTVRLSLWNHPGDDLYGMFSGLWTASSSCCVTSRITITRR